MFQFKHSAVWKPTWEISKLRKKYLKLIHTLKSTFFKVTCMGDMRYACTILVRTSESHFRHERDKEI